MMMVEKIATAEGVALLEKIESLKKKLPELASIAGMLGHDLIEKKDVTGAVRICVDPSSFGWMPKGGACSENRRWCRFLSGRCIIYNEVLQYMRSFSPASSLELETRPVRLHRCCQGEKASVHVGRSCLSCDWRKVSYCELFDVDVVGGQMCKQCIEARAEANQQEKE